MLFGKKQEITNTETTVYARAKINLTLDVTGKREDGYHTVKMVMQSVALHDEVRVTVTHGEKKPRGIVVRCNLPYLPVDERNLAYRAAELFYESTGILLETCEIHIEKRIPVAAGLAGGSADGRRAVRDGAEAGRGRAVLPARRYYAGRGHWGGAERASGHAPLLGCAVQAAVRGFYQRGVSGDRCG